jgi:hypothetical protein
MVSAVTPVWSETKKTVRRLTLLDHSAGRWWRLVVSLSLRVRASKRRRGGAVLTKEHL